MSQVPPFADLSRNHSKDAALVPLEVSAEIEGDGRTHLVCCPRGERALYFDVLWEMWSVASEIEWSNVQMSKLRHEDREGF